MDRKLAYNFIEYDGTTATLQDSPDCVNYFISESLTLVSVVILILNVNDKLCIGIWLAESHCFHFE